MTTKELEQYIKNIVYNKLGNFDIPVKFENGNANSIDAVYVFSDGKNYHFFSPERGAIRIDIITNRIADIIYLAVGQVITKIASNYELKNREPNKDFRRVWFAKEIELWALFGEDFHKRKKREIENTLINNPYVDRI